jgi:hypothetical protein
LNRCDAIKKAVLSQLYYAEKSFSDNELKEMGYLPRIFDPALYATTKQLLNGGNKDRVTADVVKYESKSESKPELELELLSDSAVSSNSSAVVDGQKEKDHE